jgi:5-methylcytosine-specific restriction enzyme subunit McrC
MPEPVDLPDFRDVVPKIPTTHTIKSRETIDIRLEEVLVDGRITVFPHIIENSDLLSLSFIKNKIRLSAGKYIGLIPLAPGVVVDVLPKLPISNLAHVLDVARQPVASIAGIERTYLETALISDSVFDFLTVNYLAALRDIQSNGWLKEYVAQTETTSHPKGRIDLAGTFRTAWSRGAMHQVRSKSFAQTSDVSPNRLLRHTLEMILLSRSGSRSDPGITSQANEVLRGIPSVVDTLRGGDLSVCQNLVEGQSLPTGRSYYYRALEIALLVLSEKGISFQSFGTDVTLDTSIIDFETVFEDYVRRVLQRGSGNSIIVKDGNTDGKRSLFDDRKSPPAQPDIVLIEAESGNAVVLDVKYKDKPNRSDINQVVTYALTYRSKRVVLVHQNEPSAAPGLTLLGRIDHVEVYAYAINLDNPDLLGEEAKMSESLFQLLN